MIEPDAAPAASPSPPRRSRRALLVAVVLVNLLLLTAVLWVVLNRQRVDDQITVWRFEPSAELSAYADRADLSDEGRFLLWASRPEIADDDTFDGICSSSETHVGVLGCYLPVDKRIYLFDVTDDRLDGIEEVVAAHEMLHAAWDRFGDDERARLTELLEEEASRHVDDESFQETLDFYDRREPAQRANELHSILGTEFADISPELEAHYARYFADRTRVLELHEASNAVFDAQEARAEELVTQIESAATSITEDYESYTNGYDALNADIALFNERAEEGDFASQDQFDAERQELLARETALDALYSGILDRRAVYEAMIAELDELNATTAQLNAGINIPQLEQRQG